MQFKANLYTNVSGNSPFITYHSIANMPLTDCGDLTAPNTNYMIVFMTTTTQISEKFMSDVNTKKCYDIVMSWSLIDHKGKAKNSLKILKS